VLEEAVPLRSRIFLAVSVVAIDSCRTICATEVTQATHQARAQSNRADVRILSFFCSWLTLNAETVGGQTPQLGNCVSPTQVVVPAPYGEGQVAQSGAWHYPRATCVPSFSAQTGGLSAEVVS
jgi:hypothetical protein